MRTRQGIAKTVLTMLVMVMMLVATTIAVSHLDDVAQKGSVIATIAQAACPDAAPDGDSAVPHNCCMAHCLSMKLSNAEPVVSKIEQPTLPVQFTFKSDVVPNQFLKSLFRPPRTIA